MAVFVELPDDDDAPQDADTRYAAECQARALFEGGGVGSLSIAEQRVEIINANRNAITEVFACYPFGPPSHLSPHCPSTTDSRQQTPLTPPSAATQITTHLDLITLTSLALTCRQIRSNLLPFRSQLISRTLRCTNDAVALSKEHTLRYRARATNWYFLEEDGGKEGKVGECARDLVGGCRRCGGVVCRVCFPLRPKAMGP